MGKVVPSVIDVRALRRRTLYPAELSGRGALPEGKRLLFYPIFRGVSTGKGRSGGGAGPAPGRRKGEIPKKMPFF